MIIHCSKKLIKDFNIPISKPLSNSDEIFNNIYAHHFQISKLNCILFVDTITLFSVFYIEEPGHSKELDQLYAYSLAITLECYGYKEHTINSVLQRFDGEVNYVVLNNMSSLDLLHHKADAFTKKFLMEIKINESVNIEEIADIINAETYHATDTFLSPKSTFLGYVEQHRFRKPCVNH